MLKTISSLTLFSLSIFFSYVIGVKITEKYFFDLIYYKKSVAHGYFTEEDFDNISLRKTRMNGWDLIDPTSNILGAHSDKDNYSIAVVGDSLVWGMGIKIEERFSEILHQKLNHIRPTTVYNLGRPGDNFLDNVSKIQLIPQSHQPDLYIVIVFINDILIWKNTRYALALENEILNKCASLGAYHYDGDFPKGFNTTMDEYNEKLMQAWKNPANICVLTEGSKYLPKNALYIIIDNPGESHEYDTFVDILSKEHLFIRSIHANSPGVESYKKYFANPMTYFYVSPKEGHPSALANRMHADFLYKEITENTQWKFKHQ